MSNTSPRNDLYFKNGKPVNMPYWERFKHLKGELDHHQLRRLPTDRVAMSISIFDIANCFNPVLAGGGWVYRTSTQQFESFCNNEGLNFFFMHERGDYVVSPKPQ